MITDRHRIRQRNLQTLVDREKTQKLFAIKYGFAPNHLSQMLRPIGGKNWRGVGDDTVERLQKDERLGLSKGWMDSDHSRNVETQFRAPPVEAQENPSLAQLRAMRFALQSLLSVLRQQRPDVAEQVAEDIVATAGTEFSSHGLLGFFLGILREEAKTQEAPTPRARPDQSSRASKRATLALK